MIGPCRRLQRMREPMQELNSSLEIAQSCRYDNLQGVCWELFHESFYEGAQVQVKE